jgi:gentisate 1,2-dioxygenase
MAEDREALLQELYSELADKEMDALWRLQADNPFGNSAGAPYEPYVWKGKELRGFMDRAAALVQTGPEAERRVIILANPSLPGSRSATHTLLANLQMVIPGDVAPAHRHTATAIRFVIEGHGAATIVGGEPVLMHPGDLVLTPAWSWHGHINEADGPTVWMDGLDSPLIRSLRASIQERYGEELETPTKAPGDAEDRFGSANLRPVWAGSPSPVSPLLSYPWAETEAALQRLARVDASPYDDVAMEYTNPLTGGHVLPTMGCWIQMLRPGVHTRAHRHMSSVAYHAFRGRGTAIIDGVRFDWEAGDFLALPPRAWHEFVNASSTEEAILFSINDAPVYESLNLQREETYQENGGHQRVTSAAHENAPVAAG